jgi:hypothetical protein
VDVLDALELPPPQPNRSRAAPTVEMVARVQKIVRLDILKPPFGEWWPELAAVPEARK